MCIRSSFPIAVHSRAARVLNLYVYRQQLTLSMIYTSATVTRKPCNVILFFIVLYRLAVAFYIVCTLHDEWIDRNGLKLLGILRRLFAMLKMLFFLSNYCLWFSYDIYDTLVTGKLIYLCPPEEVSWCLCPDARSTGLAGSGG